MIGILIFTHGALCLALRDEAERLAGHRDQVHCLSMREAESVEALRDRATQALDELDQGAGVLVFCDVAGGTPWNICGQIRQNRERNLCRIGGVGMPTLVKALQDHGEHTDLAAWAGDLTRYGAAHVLLG